MPGTTISNTTFLHRDLTDGSYCATEVLELPGGQTIGGQAKQTIYEITVLEEYAKLNDLIGTITVASGLTAKVADLSLQTRRGPTCGHTWRRSAQGRWCSCTGGQSRSSPTGPARWSVA
jgi:hypothetical protein